MATTKKKAVKNKTVKTAVKAATKKSPVTKKTAKKATKKSTNKATKKTNIKIKVTLEQRHKMICEAAYYISLDKTYETVNPTEDWLQAESFINQICTVHTR